MTNNQQTSSSPSSFSLGLALGILTGAGAFYIFGTKKGQKIKHQFVKEFQKAKEELEANPKFKEVNEQIHKAVTKWEENPDTKETIKEAKSLFQIFTPPKSPSKKSSSKVYFKRK